MVIRVPVAEGKYEFVLDEATGRLSCERYGEQWRADDLVGDKAVLALVQELHDLRTNIKTVVADEIKNLLVTQTLEIVNSATDGAMAQVYDEFMKLSRQIIDLKRVNSELESENRGLNFRLTQSMN